jgi:hypothetical protein
MIDRTYFKFHRNHQPSKMRFPFLPLLILVPVHAILPPGYEDEMWCPPGYCDRDIVYENGFAGPARIFHECYSKELNQTLDEVWTGDLTNVMAPTDWITEPGLVSCDDTPGPSRAPSTLQPSVMNVGVAQIDTPTTGDTSGPSAPSTPQPSVMKGDVTPIDTPTTPSDAHGSLVVSVYFYMMGGLWCWLLV